MSADGQSGCVPASGDADERIADGGDYEVRLDPLPPTAQLAGLWRELEQRSRGSFFLSWSWIGTWLSHICEPRIARLLSVHRHSRLVALGVVTARRRFHGIGPLHLRLHEVGNRTLDNLTIEYNGLLSESGHERAAMTAAVAHLAHLDPRWLTFHLSGVGVDALDRAALPRALLHVRAQLRPAHFVELEALRSGRDYLDLLAASTRGAIRRTARRLTQAYGALALDVAATAQERLAFLHALIPLHEARWRGRDDDGAFADPRILRFHEALIADAGDGNGVQLLRLRAGDHAVGYVYNILWRDRVYYYQAGIDYAGCAAHGSPGLLLLSRAVEHAAASGFRRYEFMAGDADYKRKLATADGGMAWLWVDRIGWVARARRAWWLLRGADLRNTVPP